MLCAEIANWVRNWSKKPFSQKSCAPLLLMAGIESGDQKEMYRNFTAIFRNFPLVYRNFFRLGGPHPPPPPQVQYVAESEAWIKSTSQFKPLQDRDAKVSPPGHQRQPSRVTLGKNSCMATPPRAAALQQPTECEVLDHHYHMTHCAMTTPWPDIAFSDTAC